MKSNHIVLTTIHQPTVILELAKNISQYGHLDDVVCWVVGDNNTPASCAELCNNVSRKGLETNFLDTDEQARWGKKFPELYSRIPFNNETRRNIGYLYALEHLCERLIAIDDDNFPTNDDFVGGHSITGKLWSGDLIEESTGFYNICEHLKIDPERLIFPRGFPFALRGKKNDYKLTLPPKGAVIGVSAGLWINEPDVDAITRLSGKVISKEYLGPASLALGQNTWTPLNSQNTSVQRELVPSFFCIPMGFSFPGGHIERYGDIWGGYFLQSLIRGTPYHICFGHPIVEHRRNEHNHSDDLHHEYWGMILTDWLISMLRDNFIPTDISIIDRIFNLAAFIDDLGRKNLPKWFPREAQTFLIQTAKTITAWAEACKQIMG
jgi:hypothetical protein